LRRCKKAGRRCCRAGRVPPRQRAALLGTRGGGAAETVFGPDVGLELRFFEQAANSAAQNPEGFSFKKGTMTYVTPMSLLMECPAKPPGATKKGRAVAGIFVATTQSIGNQ
jgi:hypothetical protein